MAKQTRTTLKGHFETGDIPTEEQYIDLIDSHALLSGENTGSFSLKGDTDLTGNITASGNISASGDISASNLHIKEYINHTDDANTYIRFLGDFIESTAGSNKIYQVPGYIQFNAGAVDIDFQVKTDNDDNTLYIVGSSDNVGIGTTVPPEKLTISGNISASGNLYANNAKFGAQTLVFSGSVGQITASGNVSSSGIVIANEANITGHITASGNISASGNYKGVSASLDYLTTTGNISASGAIWGNQFVGSNNIFPDFFTNAEAIISANASGVTINQGLTVDNNAVGKLGHITASGNISASGTIHGSSLEISKIAKGGIGTYGGTIIVPSGGKAFTFLLTGIPTIVGINSGQISKSAPTLIQNASVEATDAIIINCINQQLSATAFGQSTAAAAGTAGFYINLSNDSHLDFTAGTAQFTVVVI